MMCKIRRELDEDMSMYNINIAKEEIPRFTLIFNEMLCVEVSSGGRRGSANH